MNHHVAKQGPSSSLGGQTITFLQPYVPHYRVALFETLAAMLAAEGFRLQVMHPMKTENAQSRRNDAALAEWSSTIRSQTFSLGGRSLHYRHVKQIVAASAVVVAELASTNLDTYALALQTKTPLVLWGHGKAYVTKPNRLDQFLELWLARRADHVFTYTDNGARFLTSRGISPDCVSAVNNSTDTAVLKEESSKVSPRQIEQARIAMGTRSNKIALFVGALDESKRLDLLLAASKLARMSMPDFQLIVAGNGPLEDWFDAQLASHPEIIRVPHANRSQLALLGKIAQVCVIPGRVGLVAVDALALGLPLITTDWPLHGPEFGYLTSDVAIVTPQVAEPLGDALSAILCDKRQLDRRSRAASELALDFSIEIMAVRMRAGLLAVATRGRSPKMLPRRYR